MHLYPTENETIVGTARAIRDGKLSCVDVVNRCLANIDAREHEVHAWVGVDREGALNQAHVLDQELASGLDRGHLHGIPFGIKDIIDVAGWPTGAGFAPCIDHIAEDDAPLVACLRSAGAIILGKTVTTAFAWIDPPITRNPWNLERTPGGSSSGSAAAVACGMCLGALGTQTGGSVIRPASFCGVVGFKPDHQSLSTTGIVPFATSLDTPGLFARSVQDLYLTYRQLLAERFNKSTDHRFQDPSTWKLFAEQPKSIGRAPEVIRERADFSMKGALDFAYRAIAAAGTEVIDIPLPLDFDAFHPIHRTIMAVEAAEAHETTLATYRDQLPPQIRAIWEEGLAISGLRYVRALNQSKAWCLDFFDEALSRAQGEAFVEFLIMPAAIGAAPAPSTTGDPWMNSPWTMLGHAVLTIPAGLDAEGMPLGIQLVACSNSHVGRSHHLAATRRLFAEAYWIEQTIQQSLSQKIEK